MTYNVYNQQHERLIGQLAGRVRRSVTGSAGRQVATDGRLALAGVSLRRAPILEDGQGRISVSEAAGGRLADRAGDTTIRREKKAGCQQTPRL